MVADRALGKPGSPANATSAPNRVFTGTGSNAGRPNAVAGCNLYSGFQTLNAWFNTACFTEQAVGTYGNAGRDIIIAPNLWNLDDSLTKDFRVKEVATIQFRAEAFNIMNHPSFQLPNAQIFAGAALNLGKRHQGAAVTIDVDGVVVALMTVDDGAHRIGGILAPTQPSHH